MSTYTPSHARDAQPSRAPTRKLSYAAVTSVVLYLLSLLVDIDQTGEQLVNVIVPLILAYRVPNDDTPGGVPQKTG